MKTTRQILNQTPTKWFTEEDLKKAWSCGYNNMCWKNTREYLLGVEDGD